MLTHAAVRRKSTGGTRKAQFYVLAHGDADNNETADGDANVDADGVDDGDDDDDEDRQKGI